MRPVGVVSKKAIGEAITPIQSTKSINRTHSANAYFTEGAHRRGHHTAERQRVHTTAHAEEREVREHGSEKVGGARQQRKAGVDARVLAQPQLVPE